MALTKGQFVLYQTIAKMQTANIKNSKRVSVIGGGEYLTEAVNNGGYLLASGNYANPIDAVIPHTGGGALTALRVNELQDGGAYTLPLASSVAANQWIDIYLPDTYSTFEPTVTRAGTDTITTKLGTDTVINFDSQQLTELRLYSNGVLDWRA